jgi:hypothetical protein
MKHSLEGRQIENGTGCTKLYDSSSILQGIDASVDANEELHGDNKPNATLIGISLPKLVFIK